MTTATFDTHAAVRAMEKAGLEAPQAEAITDTIRSAVTEGVTTASDVAALRTELAEVKTNLEPLATKVALAELETRMTRTLYGVAAALLAGQLAAVLALPRLLG